MRKESMAPNVSSRPHGARTCRKCSKTEFGNYNNQTDCDDSNTLLNINIININSIDCCSSSSSSPLSSTPSSHCRNNRHRTKWKPWTRIISETIFVMLIAIIVQHLQLSTVDGAITHHSSASINATAGLTATTTTTTKKSGRRPPQRFEMEPIDKTSIVGDTIILPCRVANKVGTLQWTRDGFGLGTERSLEGFQRYRMVGSDDEGDYSLEISPVALEDDAVFQCQVGAVDGVLGIRSRSAKFTVQVPPEPPVIVVTHAHSHAQVYKSTNGDIQPSTDTLAVSAPDSVQNGDGTSVNDHQLRTTAGMTIELTCEAHGGRPPAELTWMDSDGNPITNGVSYSTTKLNDGKRWNAALKWTVVASRALDGQRVTCRSENAALKSPRYAHIQLEVRYAPEVELRIASVGDNNINGNGGGLVREGDDLTLECIAVGNPSRMTFKWSRDGVPLGTEGDVGASGGDGTPRLVFRKIGKEFHGTVIACEVANSVGTSRAKLDVKVAFKPRFVRLPEPVIGMAKNENIRLQCQVDSYPPAQITWSKYVPKLSLDGNSPDRFTDHWQEIGDGPSIQASSAGRYRCVAKNSAFEDELKGETLVFIKGAPLIRSPSIQYGVENEPIRLQCIVEALPPPTKITWFKLKPTQQILGVDNNEGYEILEEEDPDDYSMFQPSYLTSSSLGSSSASSSSASSSMSTSSSLLMDDQQQPSSFAGYLALLRSVIYIRRAKDSDFGQYNCSVWNQYGFQSQIITLQKQSNILSPLVLTLSGIICFGVIFVLLASLVVFICLRSQRLSHENSLAPKKLESNDLNRAVCATSCNGSVIDGGVGVGGDGEDFKINPMNSLEKNVLMKQTIMKMTGSNQVLTTVANGGHANDLLHVSYMNHANSDHQNSGGMLPSYNEYGSYSYQYSPANNSNNNNNNNNNDLIIANGNGLATAAAYNYDNMTAYSNHYLAGINDSYVPTMMAHHDNNVHQQQPQPPSLQPPEADKNMVTLSNYYHQETAKNKITQNNNMNNHLYSTVKKNHSNMNDPNTNSNTNSSGGKMINSMTPTNYATLMSPVVDTARTKLNQTNATTANNDINNSHSYANTNLLNYSSINPIRSKTSGTGDQFVNPYVRTSSNNTAMIGSNGLSMNHYSNVDSTTNPNGDRMLSAGVYNAHQHSRYKTNSLGGGSSSSGVISTGGSSPGHSPVGSMSGSNPNGTHV